MPDETRQKAVVADAEATDHFDETERGEITNLLRGWESDGGVEENQLLELVYQELHLLANRYLRRERHDHTLEPRALVNEAYLKLRAQRQVSWRNRKHFFAVAAITMRRILLDHARTKMADRRQADLVRFDFLDQLPGALRNSDFMGLRLAMARLSEFDPRLALVVNLHCFAGLTLDESALAIGRSRRTIARDWALARAWLVRELRPN
ncbi:MAG: ECF-type sigma factor [Acidobacteriota bacterium]